MKDKDFNNKCKEKEKNKFKGLRLRCLRRWKGRKQG